MPWPVRSKRLALYNGTPAANTMTLLGTCPTGKKWLVKDWSAYNQGAATRAIYMAVDVGGTKTVWDASPTLASGQPTGNPNRHFVLNAGESLFFQTSTAQALNLTVSGAELG